MRRRRYREAGIDPDEGQMAKIRWPNPFATLVVFKDPQTALCLLPAGITFGAFTAVLTGISSSFKTVYGFTEIEVALMFIPMGVGGFISAITTGRLVSYTLFAALMIRSN
jgi:predicted MFS family arabinose efflux permease